MTDDATEITIRPGTVDDAAGTAALLGPIVAAGCYTAMEPPVTEETQREFIEWLPDPSLLLVAEERDPASGDVRIVGMQDLIPLGVIARSFGHTASISTFVALDRHRRGIGARLFAETYRRAPDLGFEKLLAFVRADNDAGRRAYFSQGFRLVGVAERQTRVGDRYVDELILERFVR